VDELYKKKPKEKHANIQEKQTVFLCHNGTFSRGFSTKELEAIWQSLRKKAKYTSVSF